MTDELIESEEQPPLHEEVQSEIERLQAEVEAAYLRGYEAGQQAQVEEDRFYMGRSESLSRQLAEAEREIQRLREKLSK